VGANKLPRHATLHIISEIHRISPLGGSENSETLKLHCLHSLQHVGDSEPPPPASLAAMEVSPAGTTFRARLPLWTASRPPRNGSQRPSYPETPTSERPDRAAGTSRTQGSARPWYAQTPRSGWAFETHRRLPRCTSRAVHRGNTRSSMHGRSRLTY